MMLMKAIKATIFAVHFFLRPTRANNILLSYCLPVCLSDTLCTCGKDMFELQKRKRLIVFEKEKVSLHGHKANKGNVVFM